MAEYSNILLQWLLIWLDANLITYYLTQLVPLALRNRELHVRNDDDDDWLTIHLTGSQKLTGSQLSLLHGIKQKFNKK